MMNKVEERILRNRIPFEADEIFDILMGDRVEPRREFIDANAKYVKNLDY